MNYYNRVNENPSSGLDNVKILRINGIPMTVDEFADMSVDDIETLEIIRAELNKLDIEGLIEFGKIFCGEDFS